MSQISHTRENITLKYFSSVLILDFNSPSDQGACWPWCEQLQRHLKYPCLLDSLLSDSLYLSHTNISASNSFTSYGFQRKNHSNYLKIFKNNLLRKRSYSQWIRVGNFHNHDTKLKSQFHRTHICLLRVGLARKISGINSFWVLLHTKNISTCNLLNSRNTEQTKFIDKVHAMYLCSQDTSGMFLKR